MGKNKISISIAGHEFVVSTDEEREYTIALAQIVDEKVRGLLENVKLNTGLAAILACLDLCDQNEKNKQACARLREEIKLYLSQVEAQQGLQEELTRLKQENKALREQLGQYEAGQIGFGQ
ncbi:MAG: cell division protein ZapA [Clostridia bacterium]|nr:cell division protein ZapA [Clostridia bacterium]